MSVFVHGVASFDPTPSSILLWTRLSEDMTWASWALARDPQLTDVVASGGASTGPHRDHTVVVDVGDLEPATTYWFRFMAGEELSPVGRTRTLPTGPVDSFRIGTVCCARYSVAPLGVYRALAEREVDLVLHLGDYIYEDAGDKGPRSHDPSHVAITQEDYRRRLAQVRADPDAQALHLRHPMVAIWDDHDLSDNAWRDGAKHHDPTHHGPWPVRVAAAAAARHEWLPQRLRDEADPRITWRSIPLGDLAELILLDTRFIGRDRQAGDEAGPALDDPGRSLLGAEQRRWLRERLLDTSRSWAVVASSVVVNSIELPWPRPLASMNRLLPNGYAMLDGHVMHDDQWDGYPAERDRLVSWIVGRAAAGGRTVLLSGDVHSSWAFTGPTDPSTGDAAAVEFTTPAVSSAAMGRARYPGMWRLLDRAADALDHVTWSDVTSRGYTILEVRPDDVRSEWWFVHPYDEDPTARAELAAAFVTERSAWPPSLWPREEASEDPARDGLPAHLPGRPPDLASMRRKRRVRVAAEGTGFATVAGATLAAAALGLRHFFRGRPRKR